MTIDKWTEKVGKIADKLCNDGNIVYCNDELGATFTDKQKGVVAYRIPGHVFASASSGNGSTWLRDIYIRVLSDSVLADKVETGTVEYRGRMVKAVRFTNGMCSRTVRAAFLKDFPKDTLYCVGTQNIVLAFLWDGASHPIGMIAPITNEFVPDADAQ